jgi:hypothetical protein
MSRPSPGARWRPRDADGDLAHPADVFLLGAGFSRAVSERMPLLQDLAKHVAGRLSKDLVPPEVMQMMDENFAHALSYLEQAKPWLTEADNLRHRALFLEFSSFIAEDLEEIGREITRNDGRGVPAWIQELIRHWHSQRCIVLSLNYDTLIETIAAETKVADDHAIAARDLYPPLVTDAALRSGSASEKPRLKTFRLLKLHGSTNWYYSGRMEAQGEPIYFVPPHAEDPASKEQHEYRLRSVADKYPFLVPPIFDKSSLFTHETIRALWFEAGEALHRARRVVAMGYSLPESDLTMMHFLRTRLGNDAQVEIVDPSEKAADNFRRVLGKRPVHLRQCFSGSECIREFVASMASDAFAK